MKRVILSMFLLYLLLSSCASLTDSQMKNINAFAVTAKNYSEFPSAVVRKTVELQVSNQFVNATQLSDAQARKTAVENARQFYKRGMVLSEKFDLSLKLLQQYAGLLAKLSSDKFVEDLGKNSKDLGENLTGLVKLYNSKFNNSLPSNVGDQISKAVLLIGSRLTKQKQAKELKKLIPAGDALITVITQNLNEVLDSDAQLKGLLKDGSEQFVNAYKNIIFSSNSITYPSILFYHNTLTDYENTISLREKTSKAATSLRESHQALTKSIEKKQEMADIEKQTQTFIEDVITLHEIFKAINIKSSNGQI